MISSIPIVCAREVASVWAEAGQLPGPSHGLLGRPLCGPVRILWRIMRRRGIFADGFDQLTELLFCIARLPSGERTRHSPPAASQTAPMISSGVSRRAHDRSSQAEQKRRALPEAGPSDRAKRGTRRSRGDAPRRLNAGL
jgi:hypothetical protein